jgi:hypothetical protein
VPWAILDYDPELSGFVVPLDQSMLEGAPHHDLAELRDLGGADHSSYDETIARYYAPYGAIPY